MVSPSNHEPRGIHFHLSVALRRRMKTRNDKQKLSPTLSQFHPLASVEPLVGLRSKYVSKPFTRANSRSGLFSLTLALVFALAWAASLSFSPAAAQSGPGLRVVSSQVENNFPKEVVLRLTAEADTDIVSVRLNYRSAYSGVWSYANLKVTPGRRVSANFIIATSGASFLVPGTRIEYVYLIQDSLGNALTTDTSVVEYTDNRFSWEEAQIGPLTLLYHDIPRKQVDGLVADLEPEISRLLDLLTLDQPPDQPSPIRGFIYNHQGEAEDAFPHFSRTTTEQQVFHGFAFSSQGVFVGIDLRPRLIVHESTHLLLAQAMSGRTKSLPAWLEEGLASYLEPDSRPYDGRSLSSRTPPLRLMDSVSGTPMEITNFYRKSESVVAFLVEQNPEQDGLAVLQDFLIALQSDSSVEQALAGTYGFGIEALDRRWAASGRGPSAPAPGSEGVGPPSPFLYFDTWLIGGLAVLALGVVLVKYLVGKLRPADELEEEGLQPWEDPDLR